MLSINTSGIKSFLQLLSLVLVFVFILVITFFTTKWIAKHQQGVLSDRNIRVIETFRVTNNKFIQIIEVGTKYLVISVCKDTIQILTELKEDQLVWKPSQQEYKSVNVNESFQEILKKLREKVSKK